MAAVDFSRYTVARPDYDEVAEEYRRLLAALEAASDREQAVDAVERWDGLRQRLYTWSAVVEIRYCQDTQNESHQEERTYRDQLQPKLTELDATMKRSLLESPHRAALEQQYGQHAFDLWKCDIAAFDPAIKDRLVQQSKLEADYTALLAGAQFDFQGESLTLSEIRKYAEHPDRRLRHDAEQVRWAWFGDHRAELDRLFDDLVSVRRRMAGQLGYDSFIDLGYLLMQRTDYDRRDVEQFRSEVEQYIVPLCVDLRRQQAEHLGIDPLMAWDESLHDPAGNPAPHGDHDWMIDQAQTMFGELGGGMDEFFAAMRASGLMDLKSREGKAGGGFCEGLPEIGMPMIFANFNGTKGDVEVFTHEMGHAFQNYSSRQAILSDYFWPTCEACEIHSMGLEFLTWPQMELFFGDEADRFRRLHLVQSLLFLPYGTAVDHFQHLVYAEPNSTPDDRAGFWQQMEQTYLPTLRWGDLAHPASGRRWQAQLHIYTNPFYYIDYALALTCALQLWLLAESDRDAAMAKYLKLCRRGGEVPFRTLVEEAGLQSPFEEGCLKEVARHAAEYLR